MSWYHNMKIGTKLIAAFLIVAFIAGGIGLIGIINIQNVDEKGTFCMNRSRSHWVK